MEAYEIQAGRHPLSHDEVLVAWLDGMENVGAHNVPSMHVTEEQTTIRRYDRGEDGRVRLVSKYERGALVSKEIKMAKPLVVSTPDWLWRAVVMTKIGRV